MDLITAAREVFEQTFPRDSPPLPARAARLVDELRRQLEYMEALASGRVSAQFDTPSLFDPRVCILLMLSYWYAVETAGRDAAKAELLAFVKQLTRGVKGRPSKITAPQVQEAKRLRDAGRTYGEIAQKLGLGDDRDGARKVRTALLHSFPEMKPTEKKPR